MPAALDRTTTVPGSGVGFGRSSRCIRPGPCQTRAFIEPSVGTGHGPPTRGRAYSRFPRNIQSVSVKGLERLREILAEVFDLQHAAGVLSWDQDTYMPPGGVRNRAEQVATLRRVAHERFVSDETGELLERADADTAGMDQASDERSLVRVTKRDYDKSRKLPAELISEMARSASEARPAWSRARRESEWSRFAPHLARNVQLNQQLAELLGYDERPYDALLDRTEPGMTHAHLTQLFAD